MNRIFKQLDAARELQEIQQLAASTKADQFPKLKSILKYVLKKEYSLEQLDSMFMHSVCGKRLTNAQAVKCQTCSNDLSSVICIECFDPKKHIGHKYDYLMADGMCDCGYTCTINPTGFCDNHCGNHVARDFKMEKQVFNDLRTEKVIFFLVSAIAQMVQCADKSYEVPAAILHQLVFQYNIDYLRNITSKCLFIDPRKDTGDFETFSNLRDHILPFYDLSSNQLLYKADIPAICILCQVEIIIDVERDQLSQDLVYTLISEPIFRFLMIFFYYQRNQLLIKQTTNSIPQLFEVLQKFSNNTIFALEEIEWSSNYKLARQLMSEMPVQLYTDHYLDYDHSILMIADELLSDCCCINQVIFDTNVVFRDFKCMSQFATCLIDIFIAEINNVSHRLYNSSIIQNLVFSSLLSFERYLMTFCSYSIQDKKKQQRITFIQNFFLYNVFICYSSKIAQYFQIVVNSQLPYFCHLLTILQTGISEVPRYRNRKVLRENYQLESLYSLIYTQNTSYEISFGIYVGLLLQQEEDVYSLKHHIMRTNDQFVCQGKCRVRDFHVSLILYMLVQLSQNERFYFCYSSQNRYPQLPYGHGVHTQAPIIPQDCDMDAGSTEMLHIIENSMITLLAFILQAKYEYASLDLDSESPHKQLQRLCDSQCYISQLPRYNLPIIASWSIRQSVTQGLLQAQCFRSLVDYTEVIKFGMFENMQYQLHNHPYHNLVVMQQILYASIESETFTLEMFISEYCEHFGIVSPITNEFSTPNKNEDKDKMLFLYQFALRNLLLLLMKRQFMHGQEELKQYYLLALLLIHNCSITISEMRKGFKNDIFYNSEVFEELLGGICNSQQENLQNSYYYQTSQCAKTYSVNQQGLAKLDFYNAFIANCPYYLTQYIQQAKQLKISILPPHIYDNPVDDKVASKVFTNKIIVELVQYLIEETFSKRDNYSIKNDYNEICIIIAARLIARYDAVHKNNLTRIVNLVKQQQSEYSDLVWQVINDVSRQDGNNKVVSMPERLHQLHRRLNIGNISQTSVIAEAQFEQISPMSPQAQQLIQQLECINNNQCWCNTCKLSGDGYLFFMVNPKAIIVYGKQYNIGQTCRHLFHESCISKENSHYVCPICRQHQPIIIPFIFQIDGGTRLKVVMQLLNVLCQSDEFKELGSYCEKDQDTMLLPKNSLFLEKAINYLKQLIMDQLEYTIMMNSSARQQNSFVSTFRKQSIYLAYLYYNSYRVILESIGSKRSSSDQCLKEFSGIMDQFDNIMNSIHVFDNAGYIEAMREIEASGKYRYLPVDIQYDEYKEQLFVSSTLNQLDLIAGSLPVCSQNVEFEIFKFPYFYTELLKQPYSCRSCSSASVGFCVFCGEQFCKDHIEDIFMHAEKCHNIVCFYEFKKNVIFYQLFTDCFYYASGPYLSEDGEEDCERSKQISLFLNQQLVQNLRNMLSFGNSQLSLQFALRAERIFDLIRKWNE